MGKQGLPGILKDSCPAPSSLTGSVNPNPMRSFEIPTCEMHTFCDC